MTSPARRYSWPPFEEGNTAAMTHGIYRAGRAEAVAARVELIAEQVATQYGWTRPYGDERRHYARAVCDEEDMRAYLDEVGYLDEQGHERSAVRTLERFAARAARARQALGLNPMAHARLLSLVSEVVRRHPDRTTPVSEGLASLLAEGRAALERGVSSKEDREP
jgi:hypothetical protein